MDKLIIKGGKKLSGEVTVSASKNAALPILASTILFPQRIKFENLPNITDIKFFSKILGSLGAKVEGHDVDTSYLTETTAEYDLVRKMRASILVLGPLLGRFKEAKVSLPGGCAIGSRPVDIHLEGLKKLGAQIELSEGYIKAKTDGLKGSYIHLPFASVGATENLMMAAVWAEGETTIDNAAFEPEVTDLAHFLQSFGTQIDGIGTRTLKIKGRSFKSFSAKENASYNVIGDRIEASTYVIAALITNSELMVKGFNPKMIETVLNTLEVMGAKFDRIERGVIVYPSGRLNGTNIATSIFPGFPTDAQAQLMALMGISYGSSIVSEHIFENRFMHVPELSRMGMNIKLDGRNAIISGVEKLNAAPVMCTDLRASAALILAALVAEGETTISRIYHLDRGYEDLAGKFQKIGADIQRVKE